MISMHMQDLKDPLRWHNKPIRNTLSQRTLGKKKKEKRSSGLHSTAERQISVCDFGLIYMVCPECPTKTQRIYAHIVYLCASVACTRLVPRFRSLSCGGFPHFPPSRKTFIITTRCESASSVFVISLFASLRSFCFCFFLFLIKHAAIKFQLCLRDWKTIFHSGEHEKLFPKKKPTRKLSKFVF